MTLIPTLKPALGQLFLSLNAYHKIGSSAIADDLHKLGYGISYTETRFTEDKWAEWSSVQSAIIPSNIYKGITTTHVVYNIDWKNKDLNSPETHNTNSILIQNCSDDQQFSQNVTLEPNYDFARKDHKSFKAEKITLPDINLKRGIPKLMSSIIEDNQNKEFKKFLKKTLGWVLLRDNTVHPSEQNIPAWISFNQILEFEQNFLQANFGYLPPITAPPTQMNVIYEVIN